MKNQLLKFKAAAALCVLCVSAGFSQTLAYETQDKNAPAVYFTSDISAAGLMKVYNALNQDIGKKVAVKVSFGAPDEQVLDAGLLSDLIKKTDGTMVDCKSQAVQLAWPV